MLHRTPQAWLLWLCLAAYSLAGVCGSVGLVVCFGPQGHVALEALGEADCGGCLPGESGSRDAPAQLEPVCPCDDVLLPGASPVTRKAGLGVAFDVELLALPPTVLPARWIEPARIARTSLDPFADALRASSTRPRSVVLLV